jgi:WD repeat and SOF domain-containing protein 1
MVQVWNYNRSKAVGNLEWGADSVLTCKYNPSEPHILASTGIDRSLVLYDLRTSQPLHKTILANKSQCIAWNPYQPLHFSAGNDDGNVYTFDIRRME